MTFRCDICGLYIPKNQPSNILKEKKMRFILYVQTVKKKLKIKFHQSMMSCLMQT